uniref:PRP1 splicing factor N-terminal domain-containing protein n=1 Tax=Phaeomonas parva TaxID=124430 RepID=A0A7S1U7V1_9STRA|mmetsp:Transcript_3312/g.9656  ORF Transcript_3312/g.9656 Transcript_3312/m.9656 type:complete len:932 (+) Transcript_3312:213-3008(+)
MRRMLQTCGRIAARARVARAPPAPAATMARGFKGLKSFDQLEPAPTNMPLPDTKDDLREYNPGLASTYMNENLEFHEEYKKIVDDLESFLRPDVLPDEDGLLHTPEVKQLGDVLIGLNQIETAMLMRLYQHYTGIDDEAAKEFYAIAAMGGGGGGDGGASTVMGGLAEARGQVMSLRLDKMADSVSGQTVVDPKGYLTDLNSVTLRSDAEVGDIKKAQLLLKSVTSTNPRHAPGWIAAARVEEYAGKIAQARRKIREGCEKCPEAEDVWLEAARLHSGDNAKAILADAVKHVPTSVKIWLKAADLEPDAERKKNVLRRALEIVPNSVKLWKVAIELESAADARVMLGRAVECVPHSVDMWLALARLETYENARKVLNQARTALPTEPAIWITAAKLEEAHDNKPMVAKIITRAVQALDAMEVVLDREQWLKEAEAAEDAAALATCDAIVKATFSRGVEVEDQRDTWVLDASGCLERGHVHTARCIYGHARGVLADDEDLWLASAKLEKEHGTKEQLDEVLQQAVTRCKDSEILWLMAAKHKWITMGDVAGCRQVLQQAFAENPDSEDIWLAAAKLESENDLTDRARALLAKARDRAASDRVFMKSAALERDVATRLRLACAPEPEIAEAVGREMELLEAGMKAYPTFPKFYMMAAQAMEDMDPDKARGHLKAGLRHCPDSTALWIMASDLELAQGDVTRARSLLDVARARTQGDPSPELYLAAIRLERGSGNADAGDMLLARALRECPASGLLWCEDITTAPKHAQKGKVKHAMKHCDNDPHVIGAVARLFANEGKPEKARKWFARAVALNAQLGDTWGYYYAFELKTAAEHRKRLKASSSGGGDGGIADAHERAAAAVLRGCATSEPRYGERWTKVSKRPEVLAARLGAAGVLIIAAAQINDMPEPSIEEAAALAAEVEDSAAQAKPDAT